MAKLSENLNLQVPEPMDTVNRTYFEKLILDIDEKVASQKDLEKALDGSAIASKTVTEHSYKGSNKNVESALSSIDKALDGVSETSKTEVKRISEDVRSHKLTYGGTGKYGHVMLSDATDLISSAANHTAATPLAVKKAMDRADSAYVRAGTAMGNASLAQNKADKAQSRADNAYTKAEQAFQRGEEVKEMLVGTLSSKGLDVSTSNTFEEIDKKIKAEHLYEVEREGFSAYFNENEGKLVFHDYRNIEVFEGYLSMALESSGEISSYSFGLTLSTSYFSISIFYCDQDKPADHISGKTTSRGIEFTLPKEISEKWKETFSLSDYIVCVRRK